MKYRHKKAQMNDNDDQYPPISGHSSVRSNRPASSSLEVLTPEVEEIEVASIEEPVEEAESDNDIELNKPKEECTEVTDEKQSQNDTADSSNVNAAKEDVAATPEEVLDPRIAKGLKRIQKLDSLLTDVVKKEKEVKKKRLVLESQWSQQLIEQQRQLEREGKEIALLSKNHINAIGPAPDLSTFSDDEEIEAYSGTFSPLFATQPPGLIESNLDVNYNLSDISDEEQATEISSSKKSNVRTENHSEMTRTRIHRKIKQSRKQKGKNDKRHHSNQKSEKTDSKNKNYIRRNIELAADAANIVTMTDEEKKRIEQLLLEADENQDETETTNTHIASSKNLSNGFLPEKREKEILDSIDTKLKSIMPADKFESLTMVPNEDMTENITSVTKIDSLVKDEIIAWQADENDIDNYGLGEYSLFETKFQRDLNHRLKTIEQQLHKMKYDEEDDTQSVDESRLQELLEQCRSSISTPITSRTGTDLESDRTEISDERLEELMEKYRLAINSPNPAHLVSQEEDAISSQSDHEINNREVQREDSIIIEDVTQARSSIASSYNDTELSSRTLTPTKNDIVSDNLSNRATDRSHSARSQRKSNRNRPMSSEEMARTRSIQPDTQFQTQARNSVSESISDRRMSSEEKSRNDKFDKTVFRPNSASSLPSLSRRTKPAWDSKYSELSKFGTNEDYQDTPSRSESAASSSIMSSRDEIPTPSSIQSNKSRNQFLSSPFWQSNNRNNVDSSTEESESLSRMSSVTPSTTRSLSQSVITSSQPDVNDNNLQSSFMPPLLTKSQEVNTRGGKSVRSLNPFKPLPPTKVSSPAASTTTEEEYNIRSSSPECSD
ncbi:Fibrous sheath-interacting protein 1 [Trichoplax sp. H2]|nr:Fibrous sheath-interacting protein 1 [Trichoplax sp. H2]|eukprot:RDD42931.1 Fibrous sheath-interacting protein 1 [Trichoplax sp. H2]